MKKIIYSLSLAVLALMASSCNKAEQIEKTFEYTISSKTVFAQKSVTFTDLSLGVQSRTWTFQDGTPSTSSEATVSVVFATGGDKDCSLDIVYKDGTTKKESFKVTVIDELEAKITATGLTKKGCAKFGKTITFAAEVKGDPDSYEWTFPGATPATSTQKSPEVVWNAQDNDVTVTLTIKRASDKAEETVEFDLIAGDYPCFITRPDYDYDPYSFELGKFGGWTAWNKEKLEGYEDQDLGTGTKSNLLTIVEGGANGTAHCMKIDMSVFPSKALNMMDPNYDNDYYCDLFTRQNWMCNAHLEKDAKYRLEYYVKRTYDLDQFSAYGITNATMGYSFCAVVLRNNLNDWGDRNPTLDVTTTDNWSDFWPDIKWQAQEDVIVGGVNHWFDAEIKTQAPSDDWVKQTFEFTSDGDYLNVYPYLRIVPVFNATGLYVDEIQIYQIED